MDRFFLGCYMQQKEGTVPAFDSLLSEMKPARIIELGTGAGGLSVFLGIYSFATGCAFYTYDNLPRDRNYGELFKALGVNRHVCDIFADEKTIKELIAADGRTLLLCDNGNKKAEFNLFADALKVDDIIMAHDYFPERPPPGTSTDSCEIIYGAIAEVCDTYNIHPYQADLFTPLRWFCGKRED